MRSAWTALAPRRHEVSKPGRTLTLHGAAQLAQAMVGERADWIVDLIGRKPEEGGGGVVEAAFLDDAWDVNQTVHETWTLHEQRSGRGGVQVVTVGCGSPYGQPDGNAETVVRIFDRERAASIRIGTNKVATIGDIDLAPLDLYQFAHTFSAAATTTDEADALRGLIELLGVASGSECSVTIDRPFSTLTATVHGLPWGHSVILYSKGLHQDRVYVDLIGRLPDADIDRLLATIS